MLVNESGPRSSNQRSVHDWAQQFADYTREQFAKNRFRSTVIEENDVR